MNRWHSVIDTPLGALTMVRTHRGISGLFMEMSKGPLLPERVGRADPEGFEQITSELTSYFEGTLTEFTIPLDLQGTDFQLRVWEALLDIPYGETRNYRQQAEVLGDLKAIRAVGTANGSNPVSIVVPCHRVIGSDGSLTGYAGGVKRKRWLLDLEARVNGASPPLF